VPDGISFVDVDADTGLLRSTGLSQGVHEAFIAGTEPRNRAKLHRPQ